MYFYSLSLFYLRAIAPSFRLIAALSPSYVQREGDCQTAGTRPVKLHNIEASRLRSRVFMQTLQDGFLP